MGHSRWVWGPREGGDDANASAPSSVAIEQQQQDLPLSFLIGLPF